MDERRRKFLDGERPEDVLVFLGEAAVSGIDSLADHGERVENGLVLVLPGERGRGVFRRATGVDAMSFAGTASDREGAVDPGMIAGDCPDGGDGGHGLQFLLGFAEEQNVEAGGRYAEGDVLHAYAACDCGTAYSDRWVVGER
jgi:hypothetical protein